MVFDLSHEFGTFGIRGANHVFNADCLHDLPAKGFCHQACLDAFSGRIDGCTISRRASAYYQNIKDSLVFKSILTDGARYHFHQFINGGPTRMEELAIMEDSRYRHDFLGCYFILEHPALYHGMADIWIEDRHDIESLDHIWAVVTGEADIGFQMEGLLNGLDTGCQVIFNLWRTARNLQKSHDKGGKFVTKGQTSKFHAAFLTQLGNFKTRGSGKIGWSHADALAHGRNFFQEITNFLGIFIIP